MQYLAFSPSTVHVSAFITSHSPNRCPKAGSPASVFSSPHFSHLRTFLPACSQSGAVSDFKTKLWLQTETVSLEGSLRESDSLGSLVEMLVGSFAEPLAESPAEVFPQAANARHTTRHISAIRILFILLIFVSPSERLFPLFISLNMISYKKGVFNVLEKLKIAPHKLFLRFIPKKVIDNY